MKEKILELEVSFKEKLAVATDAEALEALRVDFLGKKALSSIVHS